MSEIVTLGDCTLIHGDCREVLPTLGRFDAVITDPPYGLGDLLHRPGMDNPRWGKHFGEGAPKWDRETCPDEIELALSMAGVGIVWGGHLYALPPNRCWLVWNKIIRNFSTGVCELAWTSLQKPIDAFDYSHGQLANEGKLHPTQKPLPLMVWCVEQAGAVQTILDPFMGSGTTGVACVQLGRKFTGIERERKYFDACCERISRAQAQGQLIPHEMAKQVQQELAA